MVAKLKLKGIDGSCKLNMMAVMSVISNVSIVLLTMVNWILTLWVVPIG